MDRGSQVKSSPEVGASSPGDPRRGLPAVSRLADAIRSLRPQLPGWAATGAARRVLERARRDLEKAPGDPVPEAAALAALGAEMAGALAAPHPRRVVNATGVILHTNLGRAVLAEGAARAVFEVASSYSDLELDLREGGRGSRVAAVVEKLLALSGAEGAFAVNNNAAAVLLALDTLARGREVVVSRGELVEIGGSFRVPEIMQRAGVRLIEVGTTNRTHPDDYRRAIGPDTALLLKVHRSNFELRGFVSEVDLETLAEIGRDCGVPVLEDLGSGTLVKLEAAKLPADAYAPARLGLGADLLCFSGDKLLGGPQAGILLGRGALIARLQANPLARALRLDKLSLAALDWTLNALLDGRAETDLPAVRALVEPLASVEARARRVAEKLAASGHAAGLAVEADEAAVGGGAVPGLALATWVVTVRCGAGPDALASRLRRAAVPVLVRIRDDAVVLDARTLCDADLDDLANAFATALASPDH